MEQTGKETLEFIQAHRNEDVRKLAFTADKHPGVDMPFALDQIQGWQTARHKLPSWASADGIVYPPHLNMEQCSSEFTANYKSGLLHNVDLLIDLTGGFGVDFSYMSRKARHAIYVERNPHLCFIAKHNFSILALSNAEVVNADSTEYLQKLTQESPNIHKSNFISSPLGRSGEVSFFLDPARRDSYGRKMASISDCEPNVISLLPDLAKVATTLILKLSPMLDWHEAVREINSADSGFVVSEIHIVSVKNECKELLLVAKNKLLIDEKEQESAENALSPTLICVNDEQVFTCPAFDSSVPSVADKCFPSENKNVSSEVKNEDTASQSFLLVPNSSIMKAGCFSAVATKFDVCPIGRDSHLFVAGHSVEGFPGREFQILAVSSMNKRELRHNLSGITHANISVRNFPMKADALRKRLKLIDGGDIYIFATTTAGGSHVLIITKKAD